MQKKITITFLAEDSELLERVLTMAVNAELADAKHYKNLHDECVTRASKIEGLRDIFHDANGE